ncbi:unknown [Clostridium sp. CAG:813]|nr:unknown [Clostridium sp. CAG:813]
MPISGVTSSASNSFFGCVSGSRLSEETIRKLRRLGIEPSTVTSEAQAQALITKLEQKLEQVHKTANSSNAQQATSSEAEMIAKAKALAAQVGVSVSSSESLSDIFSKISKKLESITKGGDSLKEVKGYKSELSSLEDEYSTIQQSQNSMYSAMNYTANMNKYILGLN